MKYLLLLFPLTCFAGDPHYIAPYETTVNQVITQEVNRSALAISDLHFNLATKDAQWAVAGSTIDGDSAGKFGVGMKLNNVFVSGTVAREGGHTGFGVSVTGKF